MKEFICLTCPNGCHLEIEEKNKLVTGNKCPRGAKFALEELIKPKRTVCTSVKTIFSEYPVISVRTTKEIDKSKIDDLLKKLSKIKLKKRVPIGTKIIENVFDEDVDIITTTDMD